MADAGPAAGAAAAGGAIASPVPTRWWHAHQSLFNLGLLLLLVATAVAAIAWSDLKYRRAKRAASRAASLAASLAASRAASRAAPPP